MKYIVIDRLNGDNVANIVFNKGYGNFFGKIVGLVDYDLKEDRCSYFQCGLANELYTRNGETYKVALPEEDWEFNETVIYKGFFWKEEKYGTEIIAMPKKELKGAEDPGTIEATRVDVTETPAPQEPKNELKGAPETAPIEPTRIEPETPAPKKKYQRKTKS